MAWFDKVRLYLIYTIASTLIVLAIAFSVLRAVLPHATGYVRDLEQVLTEQTGLPISIGSMDADMYWLVPRLKLVDVVIRDKDDRRDLLRLDEAFFALAFVDSILRLTPTVGDISLVGADINIERYPDNRWRIQGVEFSAEEPAEVDVSSSDSSSEIIAAIKNINFSLLDSDIHWRDYRLHNGQLDFVGANIFIEEFFGDHSLEINLKLPDVYGESFSLIIKTEDDIENFIEADLEIYLQGESIDMGQWLSALNFDGLPQVKGIFSGELWLAKQDKKFSQLTLDASVTELEVTRKGQGSIELNNLAGKFAWRKTDDSAWSFNSRDINLVRQGVAWRQPGSIAATYDQSGISLAASYLRAQDLIDVARLFLNEEQSKIFKTYQLNQLQGDFYNLALLLPEGEGRTIELSGDFEDLGFVVPDSDISFQGVDGSVEYITGKVKLELLSAAVQMGFGDLFRQPLDVDLIEGLVFIEQKDNNWLISSNNLYLLSLDAEINTHLQLTINENNEVFADIQSDFRNVIGASLHKYYPVSIMSDGLLGWLDKAITDGLVESGRFILHGDLSHFPFEQNNGVMEVVFDTRDLSLNFLDGWPELNNLTSHVRFHNSSMLISNVSGESYRGKMSRAKVLIPDLKAPRLLIEGHVDAPADDFQEYVWNSGLDKIMGTPLRQFQASGEAGLDLSLEIPLTNDDALLQVRGDLSFKGNELYLPMMDYALSDVVGRLSFEGDQLVASGVKAVFNGALVNIDVASIKADVSDSVDDDKKYPETTVTINGRLPADGLLRKFEWIPKNWVDGLSDWDVAVHFPKGRDDYSVRVEMASNLEGTGISVTDAVTKMPGQLLPVALELKALGDVLQLDVQSEDRFTLFATRNEEKLWDFSIDSGLIRGTGKFVENLNKDSTASLDLEYVDLLTLFKSTKKSGKGVRLPPTFFPSLDLASKVLVWNDWIFNDVKLESSWHSHGMLINSVSLRGPSLQIQGRGSWLTSWQHEHESNFKFFVNSSDLGHTMSTLNLSKSMKRCELDATVDWRWFDEPYRFSWQTVQGNAHFKMKDGEVKELDPGAGGRIVGLFNVFKLADRLTLDFKDVAGEGFAFDTIVGDFEFADGQASSSNIEITAAAADMKLIGSIGMVARNYDLTMQVKPHSSEAFFTGGALAGGPVLGAGLVLINKLLGLEKGSYDEYEITGPWTKPKVEQVGKRSEEGETGQ